MKELITVAVFHQIQKAYKGRFDACKIVIEEYAKAEIYTNSVVGFIKSYTNHYTVLLDGGHTIIVNEEDYIRLKNS